MQGFFQRFITLYRPIITELNELLSEFELSYSLWQVIFYIKNHGPSVLVEISNYYQVEKPTITRRVHRLMELGIVEVLPAKDKREKLIQLSDVGEDIYQSCREKITELEYKVFDGISENEQNLVFELLPKIRNNILKGREHE